MVGHGNRRHALALDDANQLLDVASTIEKGVIGMAMKVNEGPFGHGRFFPSLAADREGGVLRKLPRSQWIHRLFIALTHFFASFGRRCGKLFAFLFLALNYWCRAYS